MRSFAELSNVSNLLRDAVPMYEDHSRHPYFTKCYTSSSLTLLSFLQRDGARRAGLPSADRIATFNLLCDLLCECQWVGGKFFSGLLLVLRLQGVIEDWLKNWSGEGYLDIVLVAIVSQTRVQVEDVGRGPRFSGCERVHCLESPTLWCGRE
jgi:hypothetical protein